MNIVFYILLMALTIATAGCAAGKKAAYKIDFSGQRDYYCVEIPEGRHVAKKDLVHVGNLRGTRPHEKYKAGKEVVLYFFMIATDTDYTFLLDGERLRPDYESDKGYIIRFTMPEHDVTLRCISRNSMIRETPPSIEREE